MNQLQLISGADERLRRLIVEFRPIGDRYEQRLGILAADGTKSILLTTREGTADDIWPPSPPLQQVLIQTDDQGRWMALGVGMAGASHWSLSILAEKDEPRLEWDVACRLSSHDTPRLSCEFMPAVASSTISCADLTPSPLKVPGGDTIWEAGDGVGGRFRPAADPPAAAPTTIRWRWAWELRTGRAAALNFLPG